MREHAGFGQSSAWWAAAAALVVLVSCRQVASPASSPAADAASPRPLRDVVDMQGTRVGVPVGIDRVATIDDGFGESVMARRGVSRRLVATGSRGLKESFSYSLPLPGGLVRYERGASTMLALHPWLTDLPSVAATGGSDAISYEKLAEASPDVVIVRMGDCTLGTATETVERTIAVIRSLGFPVVVLRAPVPGQPDLSSMTREMQVVGQVFDKEAEALALAAELAAAEATVRSRTGGVAIDARPSVLYLGLSSAARQSGGAALVWGIDTPESAMIEQVVGARNAYRGRGFQVMLNAEQILALDPDVIFLPTAAGYHPPAELYDAPYYRLLQNLRAVRSRRVYALPWSPLNCARRVEYPIELMIMAKGAYPDCFRDIAVHRWVLDFYRRTYGVSGADAVMLRSRQWLDWMVADGF
jgi:iron complex transport system substrate-binding protein